MNIEPLQGSTIKLDRDMHCITYSWENGKKSFMRYPAALFLLCWFGGWVIGEYTASKALYNGFTSGKMPIPIICFFIVWLSFWTWAGVTVVRAIYHLLRPSQPAKLILSTGFIEYNTGTLPVNFFDRSLYNNSNEKPNFFKLSSSKIYKFNTSEVKNLRLEYAGDRQRLTFDVGTERIEIGGKLTEPEREWLYGILNEQISKKN